MWIAEFDRPPFWSVVANWGEYKIPVDGGGGGHNRQTK